MAQEFEPSAYSNDPALPITDARSQVDVAVSGYLRSLGVAGRSAKMGVLFHYANLYAEGVVDGEFRTRKVAGFTIKVTPPPGYYEKDKMINIGTNRWSIKPELSISKAINHWVLEGVLAPTFYTKNNEFDNSKTRHQEPVYSLQGHLTYTFKNKIWLSYGVTYFTGGETSVDGVVGNDLQNNSRTGFTTAIPINKYPAIKMLASAGLSRRTGKDYDSIGVFWQYRWGAGL